MGYISMAKAKQTVSQTKTRVKKDGTANNGDWIQCNLCHGVGAVPKGYNRKKKA